MSTAWTEHELERLDALCRSGANWSAVSAALGRTIPACKFQHAKMSRGNGKPRVDNRERKTDRIGRPLTQADIKTSRAAEAGRRARAELSHPTITAALFGDPLPGHSALDKRKQSSTPPAGSPANMEA